MPVEKRKYFIIGAILYALNFTKSYFIGGNNCQIIGSTFLYMVDIKMLHFSWVNVDGECQQTTLF